ncbi:MAG: hypothetical protein AAF456_22670, partial [Planctomycetota bacterium]
MNTSWFKTVISAFLGAFLAIVSMTFLAPPKPAPELKPSDEATESTSLQTVDGFPVQTLSANAASSALPLIQSPATGGSALLQQPELIIGSEAAPEFRTPWANASVRINESNPVDSGELFVRQQGRNFTPEELVNIAVYEKGNRSVVNIDTKVNRVDIFGRSVEPEDEGSGSGWVLDRDGHIVTNWHVVEGSDFVYVTLFEGE